jgi:hypothetical protein
MNTIGVILLAAATATSGIGKPHVANRLFRHHAVANGPAPPGGPINAAAMAAMAPGGGVPGAGFAGNRRFPNVRSQVFFVDPAGMKIGWQAAGGGGERVYLPAQLTVPARYNFQQGYIYRLKITDIPGRPGLVLYPTIEVAPSTPATDAYLTHNPIPCQFTEEDFDQVTAGNFVTKVVYLPDPKYQELAIAGVETLVSTRLEPGVDPILEADRRGTILMVIRVGAIDLEMPTSGSSVVSGGAVSAPLNLQPGTTPGVFLPPGGTAPPPAEMHQLDSGALTPPPAPEAAEPAPAPPPANQPVQPEPGNVPPLDAPNP